jgi:hypothetical protein
MLKPRPFPPLDINMDVGIDIDVMGVLTLGTLMKGKYSIFDFPKWRKLMY